MTAWQAGDVETNGIRLHYTRTGGAKPALVLAHGVTDNGLCWSPVAEALAAEYDVIMVDARGHGLSEAPETGYDPATQADDLAGLIKGLGLTKPLVMGHSMGAGTALALAGSYPDLPGAIVLEDPPAWWEVPREQRPVAKTSAIYGRDEQAEPPPEDRLSGMRAWFADIKSKTREQLIVEQRAAAPAWSEAELGPWADSKVQVSKNVFNVFGDQAPRAIDWPAVLRHISCPALVITADTDRGAILSPASVQELRSFVPQLEEAHITGAGHNIRREQFSHFMEVVHAFLTKQTAS